MSPPQKVKTASSTFVTHLRNSWFLCSNMLPAQVLHLWGRGCDSLEYPPRNSLTCAVTCYQCTCCVILRNLVHTHKVGQPTGNPPATRATHRQPTGNPGNPPATRWQPGQPTGNPPATHTQTLRHVYPFSHKQYAECLSVLSGSLRPNFFWLYTNHHPYSRKH